MNSESTGLLEPAPVAATSVPLVYGHIPAFLEALEKALYDDARDLYENRTPPTCARDLLNPSKLPIGFLKRALDTITPAKDQDPQNPTLFYLLDDLHTQRTTELKPITVRTASPTSTKQVVYRESQIIPVSQPSYTADAIDRAIGGLFSAMNVIAEVPPCVNADAGPIAKAGRPGYKLPTGNFQGLLAAFAVRQRGGL